MAVIVVTDSFDVESAKTITKKALEKEANGLVHCILQEVADTASRGYFYCETLPFRGQFLTMAEKELKRRGFDVKAVYPEKEGDMCRLKVWWGDK
jgi:hypothetical protein